MNAVRCVPDSAVQSVSKDFKEFVAGEEQRRMIAARRRTLLTIQGEHKKVSPPTTFVDISAIRGDFCMKFYRTVNNNNNDKFNVS